MIDYAEDKSVHVVSRYNGKPLTEFTKEELIKIIEHLGAILEADRRQHEGDLRTMVGLRR